MIDLAGLIRRRSQLDDYSPAPPASTASLLCSAHRHAALENLALRHQLAVYKKTVPRPKVCRTDRLFWVALSRVWAGWRQALVIVSRNTVLRWQRRRFCELSLLHIRPIGSRRARYCRKALIAARAPSTS